MEFLLGLAVGVVAGGAVAYVWSEWFKKTADAVATKVNTVTGANTTPTV